MVPSIAKGPNIFAVYVHLFYFKFFFNKSFKKKTSGTKSCWISSQDVQVKVFFKTFWISPWHLIWSLPHQSSAFDNVLPSYWALCHCFGRFLTIGITKTANQLIHAWFCSPFLKDQWSLFSNSHTGPWLDIGSTIVEKWRICDTSCWRAMVALFSDTSTDSSGMPLVGLALWAHQTATLTVSIRLVICYKASILIIFSKFQSIPITFS